MSLHPSSLVGSGRSRRTPPTGRRPCHPFRSAALRAAYLAFNDEQARRWPIESETRLVPTSFGQTFVRVGGDEAAAPLVLVPGDAEHSLAWTYVIEPLSREHRTFAVDHVDDVGRSIPGRPVRRPDDFVRWIGDLVDALGLDRFDLLAHSYGGWMAARYALAHPERLRHLVLLAPSATVLRPRIGLLVRAIAYYYLPVRPVTRRYLHWYAPVAVRGDDTRAVIDEMVDEALLARRCFEARRFVPPTVLTDDEWRGLEVPTLFLVGDHEVTYPAEAAVRRLRSVAPQVRTRIVPDADHHLALVAPEQVSEHALRFLSSP